MFETLEPRRHLSSGKLDLTNNKLVVSTNPPPQTVGSYTGVTGIVTTTLNPAANGSGSTGQSINPNDTFVQYTYAGESGYDGNIDGDDYFIIDKNYTNQASDGIGSQNAVGGTEGNDRIIVTWTYTGYFIIQRNHNTILTTSKQLTIDAKGGDDYISVSVPEGADVKLSIYGGDGNDTIIGGAESDHIYAGNGNDVISAGDGKDSVYGEAGDDSIRGGGSNDLIDGGDGNDTLRGDAGNDNITGGANSDRLRGSQGNDTLDGGGGRDFLAGEDGDDSLIGGAGDDVCDGGAGANNLNGGSGHDQVFVSSSDHCDDQELHDGEMINVVDMVKST